MYILFLCFRYLHRRISALAALLAVTFGVSTLFTVLSVMEGYKVKLRELVRGLESHLTLRGIPAPSLTAADRIEGEIREVPHVAATAPFLDTIAMYRSLNGFSFFFLRGIDPEKEARVGDLEKQLLRPEELERILPEDEAARPPRSVLDERVQAVLAKDRKPLDDGEVDRLFSLEWRKKVQEDHRLRGQAGKGRDEEVPGGLVVGINLLLDREVFLGDELKLIALSPDTGKPLIDNFIVVGGFKSGDFETDSRAAVARIERVQSFLDLFVPAVQDFRAEGIRIALDDYRHAAETRTDILGALALRSAGAKVPELIEVFGKIAAAYPEARIDELAGGLRQDLRAGDLISPDDAREAVREAAGLLGAAELADRVARSMREASSRELKKIGSTLPDGTPVSIIYEYDLLLEMALAGENVWEDALLGKEKPSPRMAPGEALKLAARRVVLIASERELSKEVKLLAGPRPLWVQVKTWEEQRKVLIQAVEQEKWIVGFLVFLIDVFIGCVVLLMLVLLVIEKTRDIGILLALGARPRGVVRIFLAEGLAVVALGVVLGLAGGFFFIQNINRLHDAIFAATGIRLFDPEIYQMDRIPTTVTASEVVLSIFPSVLFGFLASLVPAIWASHQDPIKAIHYE